MKLLERKFYKNTLSGRLEVEDIRDCDFMVTKTEMTIAEIKEKYPLYKKRYFDGEMIKVNEKTKPEEVDEKS